MSNVSDHRGFTRKALGSCLILAPLFLLLSAVVMPAIKSDETAQLDVIARHPDRYYLFTVFILVGGMLLVPALLGLMYMVRERATTLAHVGGTLSVLGALIAVGDATSQLVIWQMASPRADRAQMAELLKRFDDTAGSSVVFGVGGLAVLVGVVVLAIALHRSRAVPAWTAVLLAGATVLNLVGFASASTAILVVSSALLLVALGWIGRAVLISAGDEWRPAVGAPRQDPARA
jgi:hypothetical protein